MRNSNGNGSVSRMSGNRRMKWRVLAPAERVWSEKLNDYVYKAKTIGYAKTKNDAYALLYKYTNSPERFNKFQTFGQIFDMYKEQKEVNATFGVKTHLKRVRIFIKPIENINIDKITVDNIQALFNNSEYSKSILSANKAYIHEFCKYAILNKQIELNLSEYITIPKRPDKKKGNIYTDEEIENIWNQPENKVRDLMLIYLYTGLRRGEILEIQKENVFLDKRYFVCGFKTQAGFNRIIPIHKRIMPIIEKHYNKCRNILFENDFSYTNIFHIVTNYNAVIGNNKHTVHDSRKTFISRLNDAGANPTDIAKIVGHSTGSITLDVYTLKSKEKLIATVDLLS